MLKVWRKAVGYLGANPEVALGLLVAGMGLSFLLVGSLGEAPYLFGSHLDPIISVLSLVAILLGFTGFLEYLAPSQGKSDPH